MPTFIQRLLGWILVLLSVYFVAVVGLFDNPTR